MAIKHTGSNALTYIFTIVKQYVTSMVSNKVDKVDGKGLSTNDLTSTLKSNYDKAYTHSTSTHAPTNAQANVIESVKVNGTALSVSSKAVNVTVPTKTSELTNDSSFTTMSAVEGKGYQTSSQVNSIVTGKGYQTESQVNSIVTGKGYQTQSQVQSLINSAVSGITGVEFSVVSSLPSTGAKGVIYLVAHAHGTGDSYDEYIWLSDSSKFEKIGNTDIDLSAYLKSSDVTELTNTEIQNLWDSVS